MNKRVVIFLTLFLVCVVSGVLFIKFHYFTKGTPVLFEIKPGQTAGQVAYQLKEKGVIKSTAWFKLMLRLSASAKDLKVATLFPILSYN